MTKLSIVLPTYNGERYLKEALESILSQSFKDFELICINDCSTDSTLKILNEYATKDKRIKIFTNSENKKLPASLNIGFGASQGEYLTWTSDDNIYKPEALNTMIEYLDQNQQVDLVCTAMDCINEKGEVYAETQKDVKRMRKN